MGLAQTQRLMARLATDLPLLARFQADPEAVGVEFGLSPDEAAGFARVSLDQLGDFAGSLVRKRRGEVESLLPMTRQALGSTRFAGAFRQHARGYVPLGIKKHRDDAVAFAQFLAAHPVDPPWASDLARFEGAGLIAHDPTRWFLWVRLNHHPTDLAQALTADGASPPPRPTAILWFRLSRKGRMRRMMFSRHV